MLAPRCLHATWATSNSSWRTLESRRYTSYLSSYRDTTSAAYYCFAAMSSSDPARGTDKSAMTCGKLSPVERWWRDQSAWLETRGYGLRPRYRPNWQPSWLKGPKAPSIVYCEDYHMGNVGTISCHYEVSTDYHPQFSNLMDATRVADGALVMLKRVAHSIHPDEVELTQFFSTEPVASDPRNHCVRLHEVLSVPGDEDISIMVLPFLSPFTHPPFRTVGEVVDFVSQILEVSSFHRLRARRAFTRVRRACNSCTRTTLPIGMSHLRLLYRRADLVLLVTAWHSTS